MTFQNTVRKERGCVGFGHRSTIDCGAVRGERTSLKYGVASHEGDGPSKIRRIAAERAVIE